jgi:hypothetical protein
MRQLCLAIVTIIFWSATALAQHHGHGHHHGGGWGGSWGNGWGSWRGYSRGWGFGGGSLYGFGGGFAPFGYGVGYSSFGGFGGLNYYNGPVGGFGPFGYGAFGYPPIAPPYYGPLAPVVVQTQPIFIGPNPADNPAIQEWMPQFKGQKGVNGQNGNPNVVPPAEQPRQADVRVFVKPTTPEAKRKSIRYQAQGDEWFVRQNYLQAFARYKQAYSAAPDRPDPRFRMAVALAAMAEYGPAVDELKRLARLDPEWPTHGDRLDDIFGAEHNLSKNAVLLKVAAWVREDIRDPERLYLFGVLLHFNEDRDKARTVFQTASLLTGENEHVNIYLTPAAREQPAAPKGGPALPRHPNEEDAPPVPMPQAAAPRDAPPKPGREVVGPRLLPPGEPVGAEPDAR